MRIAWTTAARRDLGAIWDYIEAENPQAAELVDSAILRAVSGLALHPRRGRPGRVRETRELVVPQLPYIVVYRVEPDRLLIVRVLHGAMRWPAGRAD
jgi:toxin ParE1/3/4